MSDNIKNKIYDSNQKRIIRFTVRFSAEEHKIVISKSKASGLNPSVYLRLAALNKEVRAIRTIEQVDELRKLIGMSVNINQLAKAANISGALSLLKEILATLNEMNKIIEKIRK